MLTRDNIEAPLPDPTSGWQTQLKLREHMKTLNHVVANQKAMIHKTKIED